MGCDITVLGTHNLDLSSVEALANDLHNRFGFKIDYGYYAREEYNSLLQNDLEEGYVSLGMIDVKTFIGKFTLIDNNYQKKELYKKFGDDLFYEKHYWAYNGEEFFENLNQNKIETEKKEILKADFELENPYQNHNLYIYEEVVSLSFYYYSRWWSFCQTFYDKDRLYGNCFKNYRYKNMQVALAIGSNKLFYVNDQCKFLKGVGQGSEIDFSWDDLDRYIQEKAGDKLCSISQVFLKTHSRQHAIMMESQYDFTAFFDDFADLEKVALDKNRFGLGTLLD